MEEQRGGLLRATAPFLLGATVAAGLWMTLRRFERYEIAGASMEPALHAGDWVVVDTAAYRFHQPARGEIVMALDPRDSGRTVVKRIHSTSDRGYWLLGDNLGQSTDSRTFGLVPEACILGRVSLRYWPVERFGRMNGTRAGAASQRP